MEKGEKLKRMGEKSILIPLMTFLKKMRQKL